MATRAPTATLALLASIAGATSMMGAAARPLAAQRTVERAIAITHVTVIDADDSIPRTNETVVISGGRIIAAEPASAVRVPKGARVIDGRHKFLVPGFWDMHVHTSIPVGRELLGLYLANGVTGVRDMADDWTVLQSWRREISRGTLPGPRIVASGPYLEGGDVEIPHILTRTPAEGRAGVDSLIKLGVDFVKVHGQLTPETYFAIARRARERRIPFAGHVSRLIGAAAASDSGQRSIEHMLAIPVPCTVAESIALQSRFTVQGAVGRCSTQPIAPLYEKLVRNRTWVTPTFTAAYEVAAWPTRDLPGDSAASYLPKALRDYVAKLFPMPDSIPVGADSVGRALFAKRLTQAAEMRRAGVHLLTGTDAPLRNSPPGFGLHEELELFARGGLSPFEILRATTWEPASYFGMLDSLGTIAPGKLADPVLLDANPLVSIANTRRISVVVANGRVYDATERAKLLAAPVGLETATARR
jgi:imidazolonepropionase-like amidohydrolase